MKAFVAELKDKGIAGRLLETSHAFHSPMMDPAVEPLTRLLEKVNLKAPTIPYISNATGKWITPEEARRPAYWASHMRQTVRLAEGIGELLKNPDVILLEVGPGRAVSTFANQHPAKNPNRPALASFPAAKDGELAAMLTALGGLWAAGKAIDWPSFYERERRQRIPLPTYPFQRQRYWIEPMAAKLSALPTTSAVAAQSAPIADLDARRSDASTARNGSSAGRHARPDLGTAFAAPSTKSELAVAAVWQEIFGIQEVGINDDFYALGGDSLLAVQLINRMKKSLGFNPSVPVFSQNPTVGKLAAVADQEGLDLGEPEPAQKRESKGARESISEILTFRASGSRPPLFFLHGDFPGTVFIAAESPSG